jgi:flagellar hook assembly protein FlgD
MGVVPSTFELAQNIPNPFNPVTNIRVSLVEEANVTLKVYNLLGEEMNTLVLNRSLDKGNHRFIWAGKDDHGRHLPSGVYLYRLEVMSRSGMPLYQDTKKMILMK